MSMQAGVHERKACLPINEGSGHFISFRDGPSIQSAARRNPRPAQGTNEREKAKAVWVPRTSVCRRNLWTGEEPRVMVAGAAGCVIICPLCLFPTAPLSSPPALTSHRQHHERPPRRQP